MKKLLSFCLALAIIICAVPMDAFTLDVSAVTYGSDGYYSYSVSDGEATITDVDTSISGDITIPDTLGGYPVTSIGDYAFYECESLTSIKIPDSVTSIGDDTFGVCTSLTSITIPDSVTSIDNWAFSDCDSLTSITIGGSVTSIGEYTFYDCYSLTSITIGGSVTSIGEYAFSDCDSLTSITIPGSVTSIGHGAFYSCTSIKSITIGGSVTSIDDRAFEYCNRLTDVWYTGSKSDKEKITIGSYNSKFKNATWHYIDSYCDTDCNECGAINTAITHTYKDACDRDCNVCGASRIPMHTYKDVCDRDCNVCGTFRKPPHDYKNACDDTCDLCGTEREVGDHVYTSLCDTACNECGYARVAQDHTYDNACDAVCDLCGFVRIVPDHVYDNACDISCNECDKTRETEHTYGNLCDTTCNVCGFVREINHTYSNECDTTCNKCGALRDAAEHVYTNSCDSDCNVCGFTRTVDHVFTDACDGECDICFDTRKPPHAYQSVCDGECDLCGKTRTAADHVYDNDCDSDCNVCGKERTVITHLAADPVTENYIAAGCETEGSYDSVIYCTVCDVELSREVITIPDLGGHIYPERSIVEPCVYDEPGCGDDGYYDPYYDTCLRCGYVRDPIVPPAVGHTEGAPVEENRIEPTCTEDGSYDSVIYCTVCGEELSRETVIIPATGHAFNLDGRCFACGCHIDDPIGPPLSHDEAHPVEENRIEPTCTEDGSYDSVVYCTVCDEVLSRETVIIPATGHICNLDGRCFVCGWQKDEPIGPALNEEIYFTYKARGKDNSDFTFNSGYVYLDVYMNVNSYIARLHGINFAIAFSDSLTVIDVDMGYIFNASAYTPFDTANANNEIILLQNVGIADDITFEKGEYLFATLTFKVDSNFCGKDVSFSYVADSGAIGRDDYENELFVNFDAESVIAVLMQGDVSGDGVVNNRDLGTLMRYLNGWDIEFNSLAADVDRDGFVNNRDYGVLMRWLNGWDVELK